MRKNHISQLIIFIVALLLAFFVLFVPSSLYLDNFALFRERTLPTIYLDALEDSGKVTIRFPSSEANEKYIICRKSIMIPENVEINQHGETNADTKQAAVGSMLLTKYYKARYSFLAERLFVNEKKALESHPTFQEAAFLQREEDELDTLYVVCEESGAKGLVAARGNEVFLAFYRGSATEEEFVDAAKTLFRRLPAQ